MPSIKKYRSGLKTGGFPEKIVALTKYDSKILSELYLDKSNKMMIERAAANLVSKYFEEYVDAKARANPKLLHHIYEFDAAGEKDSRLFKRKIKVGLSGTIISYSLVNAKLPNREGYPFPRKAMVMESGQTVVIHPKSPNGLLKYRLSNGRFIQTSNPSVVENPGGDVANNFTDEFNRFTSVRAKAVLREYKFFERINNAYKVKRRLVIPRINNFSISDPAMVASSHAKEIAIQSGMMTSA